MTAKTNREGRYSVHYSLGGKYPALGDDVGILTIELPHEGRTVRVCIDTLVWKTPHGVQGKDGWTHTGRHKDGRIVKIDALDHIRAWAGLPPLPGKP